MTKKPTITTVTSGFSSQNVLTSNFENLRDGFNNTLSLDGSTPNAMRADLDINNNSILNASIVETDTLLLNGVPITTSNAAGAVLPSLTAFGASLIDDVDNLEALGTLGLPAELQSVTATAAELNTLDGISATVTELNHTDGVTSNIQTQIDGKYTPATQTTGTWEAGTSTTESLVSPAKVKDAIEAIGTPAPSMNIIGYASTSAVNVNPVTTNFQFGFSNIARTGTGQYTFTFSTARSSMDYIVLAQSTGGTISRTAAINNHSTTGFDVDVRVISSGGAADQTYDIIVFERT